MSEPTQKEIVLKTIKDAGLGGVLSKVFLPMYIPRYSARVCELNEELRPQGYEIHSDPEDGFCRYTYRSVGVDAGREEAIRKECLLETPGVETGVDSNAPIPLFADTTPAMFDFDAAA